MARRAPFPTRLSSLSARNAPEPRVSFFVVVLARGARVPTRPASRDGTTVSLVSSTFAKRRIADARAARRA